MFPLKENNNLLSGIKRKKTQKRKKKEKVKIKSVVGNQKKKTPKKKRKSGEGYNKSSNGPKCLFDDCVIA
jgi:hypothetical protein